MCKISLKQAVSKDIPIVVAIDFRLNEFEHVELHREEKIRKAIAAEECFVVLENDNVVGFILFDYRFFDQGWIELIIIDEKYRGKGIAKQAIVLICKHCMTDKIFTSTNKSNIPMQNLLHNLGFSFAGKLIGLDEGDPELFYYTQLKERGHRS